MKNSQVKFSIELTIINKFINQPNTYPQIKPNNTLPHNCFIHQRLRNKPAVIPSMPQAYICHGVQGPCPKNILDTIAATAPTIKPDSAPNTKPAIIMTNEVGCTLGNNANGIRLTAAIAANIARMTTSRLDIFRTSNRTKKGIIVMAMIQKLNNKYAL